MTTALASSPQPLEVTLGAGYDPYEHQIAFHRSPAFIRGYGGAMGGGKSRAMCEETFKAMIRYPGLEAVLARQAHTSIIRTTKKTMTDQVLPADAIEEITDAKKASGGEDWIRLKNGSVVHFIGLDDPVRWFSSEIGLIGFDEAHEIAEDDAVKLLSRLRQRCKNCVAKGLPDCSHMPNRAMFAFNPENPGHWLQQWFILGAGQTKLGFYKPDLTLEGAEEPLGDCEFVFARATDNPYLSESYIKTLKGMRGPMRERYLEGLWTFVSGSCFFSEEALTAYGKRLQLPKIAGHSEGSLDRRPRVVPSKGGPWAIWATPVREKIVDNKIRPAHRYVVSVDVSSGGSQDFSAIQVIDVEDFEQVAEYQGKIDPDLVALEAARIGLIYNNALVAPETTGGWGFSVAKELQRLKYRRLYTRPILDRLSNKFTDKIGWDTNVKTRAIMLDTLERVLREREFGLNGQRTFGELGSFVRDAQDRPAAQPGCHDDLVMSLAIGVHIATTLPRQLRRIKEEPYEPQFAATGF